MTFSAVLESDLRALSSEARRGFPAIKHGAEHAILKLRLMSSGNEIVHNDDILRVFLVACEVRNVKLSAIGLSGIQKLISHDAVAPSALTEILSALTNHSEITDESVQLKTLQTVLIIFQSRLYPENDERMVQALGICLKLLESNQPPDCVRGTAAATFRQAVALIFDRVIQAESLPVEKIDSGFQISQSNLVSVDAHHVISHRKHLNHVVVREGREGPYFMKETLTEPGRIGLRLLEDLTMLAAGGFSTWLGVKSLPRTFALEILEFVLSSFIICFKYLFSYEQVLRGQICSLLMTSLHTNTELEGEAGEPHFRRLVMQSVAHIIRSSSSILITESEVFLTMLLKVVFYDLPLWHRILVLEVLRGFCMEDHILEVLFQNFDMNPKNTNVVEDMVKTLARVVLNVQVQETYEELLISVAGMFSSKAKGVEWSLDGDATNVVAVMAASEAHSIALAIEGLLGVTSAVASLTDTTLNTDELHSPSKDLDSVDAMGRSCVLTAMVNSLWLTILDALSFVLTRSQGEAIVLEILKGYQAFTQACGVLHAVEPLNSFLASLCKIASNFPTDARLSVAHSSGTRRSDIIVEQRDAICLTSKNVQSFRTLFNIVNRLLNDLGPSWILILETLASLDRVIHPPNGSTQESSAAATYHKRELPGMCNDTSILSSLSDQLFVSSASMDALAVQTLVSALCQFSHECMFGLPGGSGRPSLLHKIGNVSFCVERMLSILANNLDRVELLWDDLVHHFLKLVIASNQLLRSTACDALDQSICMVLGSEMFNDYMPLPSRLFGSSLAKEKDSHHSKLSLLECSVSSTLSSLYLSGQSVDVRAGCLKILLHVLERHGDRLCYSLPSILQVLCRVAESSEKDLIALGFQSLLIIINDGVSSMPADCLHICVDVTGAYCDQKADLNVSLTSISLLWTIADFISKEILRVLGKEKESDTGLDAESSKEQNHSISDHIDFPTTSSSIIYFSKLLSSVFSLLQRQGADERPEVRNAAIRTLFQTLGIQAQKLPISIWENYLWNYVLPALGQASHMAATSSSDEWQGRELGTRGGKMVHMLIHHSRNTSQKQWAETLVLVFGGIARLLRSFFPFLCSLSNFWSGWEFLLLAVEDSILRGGREVALAAISCLRTAVTSHALKGSLPMRYLSSILGVYQHVLEKSTSNGENMVTKVKQEILHALGEAYLQAQDMFDSPSIFSQLYGILILAVDHAITSSDNLETESDMHPVLLSALEVLPWLSPSEKVSSMWRTIIEGLLKYLPPMSDPIDNEQESGVAEEDNAKTRDDVMPARYSFAERLVPVLIDIVHRAPAVQRYAVFPDVIHHLGGCMTTRRDSPGGSLWRVAVEGFHRVLVDHVSKEVSDQSSRGISQSAGMRAWKEIADAYEIFLVGYCGRVISADHISNEERKADEELEMVILNILADRILKSPSDAPFHALQQLVSALDHCASRTFSLPIGAVEYLPSHCSRFSLACLHKLFCLSSCDSEAAAWNATRSQVSKISITVLLTRCRSILDRFLLDESEVGACALPATRQEEIIFVLDELAHMKIHAETASVLLPLHGGALGAALMDKAELHVEHPHLLILFPSLCELVISRDARVRKLMRFLLRLVSKDLALNKLSPSADG